ncbi:MAG: TolB family protein [Myxococcota bacterium]
MTLLLLLLAMKPPTWSELDGPWKKGAYVDFAVAGEVVHAVWVEGDTLRYAKGPKWSKPKTIAEKVETGDGGQIRPQVVADGTVVYTSGGSVHARAAGGEDRVLGAGELVGADAGGVVWLDRSSGRSVVRVDGVEVYASGDDGVCMCCAPAILARPDGLAVAVRDADGPRRDVRLLVREGSTWNDRGDVTKGAWSPGGCPADGPALTSDAVLVSDARDGARRIWKATAGGEEKLPLLHEGWQQVQPRATPDGRIVTWVEVAEGKAELVLLEGGSPMRVAAATSIEPGDPVVVGSELWLPFQTPERAVVMVQR